MIQLLPLGEAIAGDHSPYSSRSAFAVDPIYIGLEAVEDLAEGGGFERVLGFHFGVALERARGAARIDPATVRAVKERALATAFARFREREWRTGSRRAAELRSFAEEHASWLADYALFRALEVTHGGLSWLDWPAPLRDREPAALAERRTALADLILYFEYRQWLADTQWREARRAAAARGVRLAGDLPFMVARESADLWAHREEFHLDATVGAPPDALAKDGQDWGLPPYRWDVLERNDYKWIRDRARRSARFFDLVRVDHVVGYYRTYVIPQGGDAKKGAFHPPDEPAQTAQGERVLEAMRAGGADLIAEDLGTIPKSVRRSLRKLAVPGFRVLRWEREWDVPDEPFIDPKSYPPRSVATSGTHDTTTMAVWWEKELEPENRRALFEVPSLADRRGLVENGAPVFTDGIREALLDVLAGSGSDLVILPLQDILGAREQINVPGTVGLENWTYRIPFSLEDTLADEERRSRLECFARLAAKHGRL